jgi:hypothetical protein
MVGCAATRADRLAVNAGIHVPRRHSSDANVPLRSNASGHGSWGVSRRCRRSAPLVAAAHASEVGSLRSMCDEPHRCSTRQGTCPEHHWHTQGVGYDGVELSVNRRRGCFETRLLARSSAEPAVSLAPCRPCSVLLNSQSSCRGQIRPLQGARGRGRGLGHEQQQRRQHTDNDRPPATGDQRPPWVSRGLPAELLAYTLPYFTPSSTGAQQRGHCCAPSTTPCSPPLTPAHHAIATPHHDALDRDPQVLPLAVRALPAAQHARDRDRGAARDRQPLPRHERHHPQLHARQRPLAAPHRGACWPRLRVGGRDMFSCPHMVNGARSSMRHHIDTLLCCCVRLAYCRPTAAPTHTHTHTQNEMVLRIFTYLDKLIHITKPKKLVLLAIDGEGRGRWLVLVCAQACVGRGCALACAMRHSRRRATPARLPGSARAHV